MKRYALAVVVVVFVVLGNSYVVDEFDWYEGESQSMAWLWHDLGIWFVACFAGGFFARRWFAIVAAVLSSLTVLAWIDLMNRFVSSSTVPVQVTEPADAAAWHLAGIVVAAVGGALLGEVAWRLREPSLNGLSGVS